MGITGDTHGRIRCCRQRVLFRRSPVLFTFIQGMAAGAMLTMISQTMLPEAYLRGGSAVGIATPLGFLAAVLLKLFGSSLLARYRSTAAPGPGSRVAGPGR